MGKTVIVCHPLNNGILRMGGNGFLSSSPSSSTAGGTGVCIYNLQSCCLIIFF